ncbi:MULTISPECIES: hypothetical protein [Yersinia]|uniref:hypothetical protein n=1 Tax=Yersinia TaxID=629 RepID=UPI0001A54211|nr:MULTISPECIES: hypothetical protein [Yersinia]EEP89652.1 hypothetical protein ykris0001_320 [Yersinia kristensenii ATCC 33638]EKN6388657.1 hypothetical protein [Yersinia enterocolitica]ELW8961366.1 hypothetical protein [Yersinia enterocolitica]PEH52525.1 hypothetical protein CRM81_03670 [Yersinia kristensenii]CNH64491.1 Uncharacterised protein [Yersinia enterocolitica]
MSHNKIIPELDADRLRENALTSIRLGVEDFNTCRKDLVEGGDPSRALSAIRNLFSGVLLLFKYKIAISVDDPEYASSLIFNPPEVLPVTDGEGGVKWVPSGKFKKTTIDLATIKKRFEGFGIEVEWVVIEKLQECRNHLEHLHPANTHGEVANFVAELFPILRDFIQSQLREHPGVLLGHVWQSMLEHHQFFVDTRANCGRRWDQAGVPIGLLSLTEEIKCESCNSLLIIPNAEQLEDDWSVEYDEEKFRYDCLVCGHSSLAAQLLIKTLNEIHYFDPRDGGEASIESCNECNHEAFANFEQKCLWCSCELEYKECSCCEVSLNQDDQINDGLCGDCNYQYEKAMRD